MTYILVILTLILSGTAFSCLLGILLRTLFDQRAPKWGRSDISTEFREWGAVLLMVLSYPFGFFASEPKPSPNCFDDRRPLILLPGYGLHRLTLSFLALYFRQRGYRWVWPVNHPVLQDDIDAFGDELGRKIDELLWRSGHSKVDIVAHSMSGLVANSYLRRNGSGKVGKLVTMGTPWRGTCIQILGIGSQAKQMAPTSALIAAQKPPQIPHLSIWTSQDWILLPTQNAIMEGINHLKISHVGHLSMLISHRVFTTISKFLESDAQD
jgi:hypothetical protein